MKEFSLNLKLFKRFAAIAKPYWFSEEKWKARGLVALLVLLMLTETWFNVYLNKQTGELTSALAARESARFWHAIRLYCASLVVAVTVYSYYYYVRDQLSLHWRRWLTHTMLRRYFANRSFYKILRDDAIDNPDQRISEDIATFTSRSISFLLIFGGAVLQLLAFSQVLWSISKILVYFLVFYAVVGTWVTLGVFGGKMVSLNFHQLKREANFRFGLVRIRENAESIALYGGEHQEQSQVRSLFGAVFANMDKLIRWSLRLSFFQYTYSLFTWVLPSIILAPRVLSGELEVGRVVEAAGAFTAILGALTIFVDNIDSLSRFAAGITRLDSFIRFLVPKQLPPDPARGKILTREGENLSFEDVTLQTPNYERVLVKGLTLSAGSGQSLMIVGPSGCGKSSLLRAMAGLWDSGGGCIERPKIVEMLFLPQHAYMIMGSLRSQLLYPNIERSVSDDELSEVLKRVNLPKLVDRCGGFDVEMDFEKILSVGERQRLAFARVLLQGPRYALLDEASSALDPDNEASIFTQLIETSITLVSVSHHPDLVRYHSQVLEITGDGGWKLHSPDQFRFDRNMG
jgi:putative ATP-binding cassette transporter